MLQGSQVLGVHNVGAVFIFLDRHLYAGTAVFFQQVNLFSRFGCIDCLDVTAYIHAGIFYLVIPAARICAAALVGIAVVEIPGQQAAAGKCHAQCTVHEHLQFHLRAVLADFFNLVEGEFARQDDAFNALLLPEADAGVVHGIGLYRQMYCGVGPAFTNHQDQPRVCHDERIRTQFHDGFHVLDKSFYFRVVRQGVAGEEKQLAGSVDFPDAFCKVIQLVKIIVAHPQAVAGHAGIHGIGTVGDRVAQIIQVAGRGQ